MGTVRGAPARLRCLSWSTELYSPTECETIRAAQAALIAGAGDLVWGGPMYEGSEREVLLELRPRNAPSEATSQGEGRATVVDFALGENMAVSLTGSAFEIRPAGFQQVRLAPNYREVAQWVVTPRDGTGGSEPGRRQELLLRIKAQARLENGRLVDLDIAPRRYPVDVLVRPMTRWQHFWRDLALVFKAPKQAIDELAILLGALGALGAAFWVARRKWGGR